MNNTFPTESSVNNALPNANNYINLDDIPHQIISGYDKCDLGNGNLINIKKCDYETQIDLLIFGSGCKNYFISLPFVHKYVHPAFF